MGEIVHDVEILKHEGRDIILRHHNDRLRSDYFEVTWNGRSYQATAGASWDSDPSTLWGLERLMRQDKWTGNWRRAEPRAVWVTVPRHQKAWRAIEIALHEHRRMHGYAQPPGPKKEVE